MGGGVLLSHQCGSALGFGKARFLKSCAGFPKRTLSVQDVVVPESSIEMTILNLELKSTGSDNLMFTSGDFGPFVYLLVCREPQNSQNLLEPEIPSF